MSITGGCLECAWISLHTSPWLHPDAFSHAMSHVRRLTTEEVRFWRSLTPSERLDIAMEMSVAASKERARQPPKRWRTHGPR